MKRALACLITAGTALAGCGGASPATPIASGDAASLRADLTAVRAAVAADQPGAADAATARMRADVARLLSMGALSPADGRVMLTALARAGSRISAEVHAPGPTTVTIAPPAPAPKAHPPKGPKPAGPGHDHKGGDGGD